MTWLVSMYVSMYESMYVSMKRLALFICISLNIHHFTFSELSPQSSNKCGICINVLKHPFRQDIFKQTNRNVVFRDYILTLALYAVHTRV